MDNFKKIFSVILVIVITVSMIPLSGISASAASDEYPEITVGENISLETGVGTYWYRFVPEESGWYLTSVKDWYLSYDNYMYSGINVVLWDSEGEYLGSCGMAYPKLSYLFEANQEYVFMVTVNKQLFVPYILTVEKSVRATGVSLSQGDSVLKLVGDSLSLGASLEPDNAIPESYTWTSSDERVATVDQVGMVSCIAPGKSTVTVTTENGLTASCEVTVKQRFNLIAGVTQTVEVAHERQYDYYTFTPEVSGWYRFDFENDPNNYIRIYEVSLYDSEMNWQQYVYDWEGSTPVMLNAGETYYLTSEIYHYNGEDWTSSFTVCATQLVDATGVAIDQGDSITVYEMGSVNLTATLTPGNAIPESYTWTSSDERVATVDQVGKVSGLALGKSTVTVTTENGLTASCEVTVKEIPVLQQGVTQNGELTDDCPVMYFSFTPEESGSYRFTGLSILFRVDLFNSDMEYLDSGDRYQLDGGEIYYLRISATFDGIYDSFTVGVKKVKNVVRLEPISPPDQTVYLRDLVWDEFDGSGMSVRVYWDDGTEGVWSYDKSSFNYEGDYFYDDIDTDTGVLTLTYSGVQTEFQLTLIDNPVDYIEIDTAPTKEYSYGDPEYSDCNIDYDDSVNFRWRYSNRSVALDLEGLVFTVYYTDGTSKQYTWEDINGERIDGFKYSIEADDYQMKKGDNPFTLTYMDHTAGFTVKVKESNIESLEIIKAPDNRSFERVFCSPDFKGMTLRIHYMDGSFRDVTFDDDNLPVSTGVNEVPFTIDGTQGVIRRTGYTSFLLIYLDHTCEIDCLDPQIAPEVESVSIEEFSPDIGTLTATVIFQYGIVRTFKIEKSFGVFQMGTSSYRWCGRCTFGLLNIDYIIDDGVYNIGIFDHWIEYRLSGEVILGDVDGDGKVTVMDATAIQKNLASIPTDNYIEEAADADGDGKFTVLDATEIQHYLAYLPSNENIGKPIA